MEDFVLLKKEAGNNRTLLDKKKLMESVFRYNIKIMLNSRLKLKKDAKVSEYSPTERLLNEEFITKTILECMKNNDRKGAEETIKIYFDLKKV